MPKSKSKTPLGDIDVSALGELANQFPSTVAPTEEKNRTAKIQEPDVTLTLKIPSSVAKDLKINAAQTSKTQREIILEALKSWGIMVNDEDIRDRRKS